MDTVEIKLLKYKFQFRLLTWREEAAIKVDKPSEFLRALLAHALTEVSGLKVATPEEGMRVMKALPQSVLERVAILYRDGILAPRMFSTVGLYKAPEPNRFVRKFEQLEEQRENIMDKVEQEMERKFGRKELDEQRELEIKMARNSKMRGATKPSPEER